MALAESPAAVLQEEVQKLGSSELLTKLEKSVTGFTLYVPPPKKSKIKYSLSPFVEFWGLRGLTGFQGSDLMHFEI